MSDRNADAVSPEDVQALAEAFLESHRRDLTSNLAEAYEREIEQLEQRKEQLDEDDELYEITTKRIEEKQQQIDQTKTDSDDIERRLLEAVAAGFLPKDEWLHPKILRALNLIFYGKYADSFVVNRQVLSEGRSLDQEEMLDISREVRALAQNRLENQ